MKSIIIGLSIFILSSCATIGLWQNDKYAESISHFLTTKDGRKLIIIGDKYHYVFSGTEQLNVILQSKYSKLLKAEFHKNFMVNNNNKISGEYRIICNYKNPSDDLNNWLIDNGFKKTLVTNKCSENNIIYSKESEIFGERFSTKNQSFDRGKKLNEKYLIFVEEERSALGTVSRIAQTPIAITIDGAMIYGVALLAPALPLLIVGSIIDKESFADECAD